MSDGRSASGAPPKRVFAVLVMLLDVLPYEEVWRAWSSGAGRASTATSSQAAEWEVRFFVHAKLPERIKSPWLRSHLLPVSFRPEWASIELVKATLALIEAALGDERVERLALVSETCVPVCTFNEAVASVCADPCSWLGRLRVLGTAAVHDLTKKRTAAIDRSIVRDENIGKADQWFLLTREHASVLTTPDGTAGKPTWWPFRNVW